MSDKKINVNKPIISNELICTLDCIFGRDVNNLVLSDVRNVADSYKEHIKNEDVLCMEDSKVLLLPFLNNSVYIMESNGLLKQNRQNAEYFSKYVQLVTAVIIHDKTHLILMNNLRPSAFFQRGTLAYVQGHVSYPEDRSIVVGKVLYDNMIREINEEVGIIGGGIINDLSPIRALIYQPIAPSTNKHACVLYELNVPDVSVFYGKETEKNSLVKLRIDQLHTQYNYLDPWVIESLPHISCISEAYYEYIRKNKW